MSNIIYRSDDRRRLVRQFGESLRAMPHVSIGFGLYWMLTILLLYSPFLFAGYDEQAGLRPSISIVCALASILAYFCAAIRSQAFSALDGKRAFPHVLAIVLMGGAAAFSLSLTDAPSPDFRMFLYLAGLSAMGAGTALCCLEFGRVFAAIGPRRVLFHGTVALLAGSIGALAVASLPQAASNIVLVAIPLPMMACLGKSLDAARMRKRPAAKADAQARPHIGIPRRFLITSAIQGLALGAMHHTLSGTTAAQASFSTLGFCIAAALLMLTALVIMQDFNTLFYRVGFPMMAAGFFIVGAFDDLIVLGSIFLDAGYCYQYLISCCLCAHLARSLEQSPIWIVGTSTGCLLVGQVAGIVFEAALGNEGLAALLLSFFLMASALYLFSNQNLRSGWGAIRPGDIEAQSDPVDEACRMAADECSVSKRGLDVLLLLAKGRTRKEISDALNLSEETVKTHTGKIYLKFSVHSKRELIAFIESRAETIRRQ